jgi:hypothetical protein
VTLSEEIRSDLMGAYKEMCKRCEEKDKEIHDLRHELVNTQQAYTAALRLLRRQRDNPAAVRDRVDYVLGLVTGE